MCFLSYFIIDSSEEKINYFKNLIELDKLSCNSGNSLLKLLLLSGKRGVSKKQPNTLKNVGLGGSTSEGSAIARIFKPNSEFDDGLNRELELDIEFILLEFLPEFKHYVEDVRGKIGYVNVRTGADILMFTNNAGWDISKEDGKEYLQEITMNGYIHPCKVKKLALEKSKLKDEQKVVEIFFAAICNEKISDTSVIKTEKVTNASAGSKYTIQIKNKNVVIISYDLVTLLRIPWWPDVALEWKERRRNWPDDQRTIDDLTQTCYIIAKPSEAERENKETLEWRYSFSDVERKLFSMHSSQQKLIYFIFKAMFYKWLKPISPTQLYSFIGKNIMLKTGEDFPPQHKMWDESYEAIREALAYLFFQMQIAFENNCLPYYFINKINVIETIKPEVKEKVIATIQLILSNIEEFIPSNVCDVIVIVEDLIEKMRSTDRILTNVQQNKYSDFLNLKFLASNLDFLFGKVTLNFLKEAIEKENIKEKISNEAARFKSAVHNERLRIENDVSKEIKRFTDKLTVVGASAVPAIQNVIHDEALRVERKAINEVTRFAERTENEVTRVEKNLRKIFRF